MRRHAIAPRAELRREEVEGFLAGVVERLAERRRAGTPRPELETRVEAARQELGRGGVRAAETALLDVDRLLDEDEEESELTEFPRGLVGYTPVGDRGRPPRDDEDPVANRLRLVERLLDVRRRAGHDVAAPLARLREAFAALRAGDRARARALGDEVHAVLDRARDDP